LYRDSLGQLPSLILHTPRCLLLDCHHRSSQDHSIIKLWSDHASAGHPPICKMKWLNYHRIGWALKIEWLDDSLWGKWCSNLQISSIYQMIFLFFNNLWHRFHNINLVQTVSVI
jgi:hypothetical protein